MRKILVSIFLLLTQISFSQDTIIFNSGFEENIIPTYQTYNLSEINTTWFSSWRSPDIFSFNNATASSGVPINFAGNQLPFKDISYAGFITYTRGITGSPIREWLGISLPSNLTPNSYYCFKAYISLADTFNFATGNIGIYFSTDSIYMELPPQSTPLPTDYSYVVSTPVNQIFLNHSGWTEINLLYQAKGDERYMYIGNFSPDSLIDYQYVSSDPDSTYGQAYYYIDEVTLYKCDGVGIDEKFVNTTELYPNPTTGDLYIVNNAAEALQLDLYNSVGQLVLSSKIISGSNYLQLSDLANGLYFAKLSLGNNLVEVKKVIINK